MMILKLYHTNGKIYESEFAPSAGNEVEICERFAEHMLNDVAYPCDGGPHERIEFWTGDVLFNSYTQEDFPK